MLKLIVVAVVVAAVAADLDTDWAVFKANYKKQYTAEEETIRKYIWSENKKFIEEHNEKFRLGKSSYYLGENKLADMTNTEIVAKMNGMRVERNYVPEKVVKNFTNLPDTVDWRTKGYVTNVKDQGQCGSCWAFSATGSMEGQHFHAAGKLVSLSESNLVDCSLKFGNNGCGGGLMDNAFKYVIANKGIDTENSYPYVAEDRNCRFNADNVGATISSYKDVISGSESALQEAVATIGPISVAIDASRQSFHFYKGGVYDDWFCSSKRLDHGVLAIGYGRHEFRPYWLVKNSWGTSWGMQGYIMMSRNRNNQCGIATAASYPIV